MKYAPGSVWRPFTFLGDMKCLEIARGHDGFLRGDPEPVVVVAVYLINAPYVQVVGRSLHRFEARSPFPSTATPKERALPSCSIELAEGLPRWIVLAVGLEDDGGEDVQRVFGALEHHRMLSVWASDDDEVEPHALASIPAKPEWLAPRPVQVLSEGQPFAATCRSDKWIGAVCWMLEGRERGQHSLFRIPFLSEDRRNDWTAIVDITR